MSELSTISLPILRAKQAEFVALMNEPEQREVFTLFPLAHLPDDSVIWYEIQSSYENRALFFKLGARTVGMLPDMFFEDLPRRPRPH